MKINLWLAASDGQDGSFNVNLVNTKEEALEKLDKESEEEIESFYEDGMIKEISLELDENGKLLKPFFINIE